MAPVASLQVLDAGRPAQIADALARGYAKVADLDEGGAPKVLLYKAVDQLRQCLDTIHERPGDRRILFHGWNWAQIEEMALPPATCSISSCRTPARARSRCACTSAPTTSAWARPST